MYLFILRIKTSPIAKNPVSNSVITPRSRKKIPK